MFSSTFLIKPFKGCYTLEIHCDARIEFLLLPQEKQVYMFLYLNGSEVEWDYGTYDSDFCPYVCYRQMMDLVNDDFYNHLKKRNLDRCDVKWQTLTNIQFISEEFILGKPLPIEIFA